MPMSPRGKIAATLVRRPVRNPTACSLAALDQPRRRSSPPGTLLRRSCSSALASGGYSALALPAVLVSGANPPPGRMSRAASKR